LAELGRDEALDCSLGSGGQTMVGAKFVAVVPPSTTAPDTAEQHYVRPRQNTLPGSTSFDSIVGDIRYGVASALCRF
jgi:hypothetical protein